MQTEVDGDKIILTLKFTLRCDPATAGYFVVEQDGPSHEIAWGPMPYGLVDAFMRERADQMVKNAKDQMERMLSRHNRHGHIDLRFENLVGWKG